MSPIMKLDRDDPERELEFKLEFQRSLTTEQRFQMMLMRMKYMNELLEKYGHRKAFEITTRTE